MNAPGDDWRRNALDDFREWLESVPDSSMASPVCEDMDGELAAGCDLHGLFREFAALRQEVRAQNREQSKAVREIAKASDLFERLAAESQRRQQEAEALSRERGKDLASLERRARTAAEADCIRSFLEVRDALARGSEAASQLRNRRLGILPGTRRRLAGVAEGYELALRRFDRVLAELGVEPVGTVGHPFDSRTMHATRTVRAPGAADGEVVEEHLAGFTRNGAVLRLADVGVKRPGEGE